MHIRNLKKGLIHRLVLENVNKVITPNKNAWLEPHIDVNTDLRKMALKIVFF